MSVIAPVRPEERHGRGSAVVSWLRSGPAPLTETRIYLGLIVFLVAAVWLPMIRTSFVIDETGTVWAISGGLRDIVHRAIHFPQSIAYCFLAWGVDQFGGPREVMLRLPSVLAGIATLVLLYKLVTKMADRTTALLASLLWALMPVATAQATFARPYAFGALAAVASYWAMVEWLEAPSLRRFLRYALLAALPAYFSYFFVLVPATQILYLLQLRRDWNVRFRSVVWLAAIAGFLDLPLLYPAMAAARDRSLHTYMSRPDPTTVIDTLIPNFFAYGLIGAIGLYLLLRAAWKYHPVAVPRRLWVLVSMWCAAPIVVIAAVSLLTPMKCFADRYLTESYAGLAVALAILLRGFQPALLRITATLAAAVFAIGGLGPAADFWHTHGNGDFRGASRFLSAYRHANNLPTFTFSGFAEVNQLPFPLSAEDESCLTAPLTAYPAGGPVTLLPPVDDAADAEYARTLKTFFDTTPQDFLLYINIPGLLPDWLAEATRGRFDREVLYASLDVAVIRFRLHRADTRGRAAPPLPTTQANLPC